MEKPRYQWSFNDERTEFCFEIRDDEEGVIIARCETKDDVKFLHSLLADDEAKYAQPENSPFVAYGSVKTTCTVRW